MQSDQAAKNGFQGRFECGKHVLVRIAHEPVGKFPLSVSILLTSEDNLLAYELYFTLEMKR